MNIRFLTSFRGKLYLLVIYAILLPLIISSLLLGSMLDRQLRESFQNRLKAGLETFSLILKHKENALIQGVSGMASDNTLQLTLELGIIPQLRKYLQTKSEVLGFSALTVTDDTKQLVASTGRSLSEFFGNGTSELITDGTETLISYTKPTYRNGKLLGYVIGAVSLSEADFSEYLQRKLVDNFCIWADGEIVLTDLESNAPLSERKYTTTKGMHEFSYGKANYKIMSGSTNYGMRELTHGILAPLAEQEREFWTMVGIIIIAILSLFGLILMLLRRFMRELVVPVTQLTKAASSIEKGEELPYLDIQRTDEFGQLSMAFKRMVENLKRSEQELRNHRDHLKDLVAERTADLRKTNEELNSFVYTVSHDLKAPVVSLQGFSSLLIKDCKDSLDEMGRMYIDRILKNSERMGSLIEDLLELSRIGRIKGQEEPVDISFIISDVVDELTPRLDEIGTKLDITADMPTLQCDRTRMIQIFANLIGNANKFMGEDNKAPTIEVGCEDQDGQYRFYVKDNGIGIDEEYHEKIFQIFQRLDDIDTEGTGVGLAIVRKIVESFGGKIWVDSAKGKGTTVYFTVPKQLALPVSP